MVLAVQDITQKLSTRSRFKSIHPYHLGFSVTGAANLLRHSLLMSVPREIDMADFGETPIQDIRKLDWVHWTHTTDQPSLEGVCYLRHVTLCLAVFLRNIDITIVDHSRLLKSISIEKFDSAQ